MSRNSEYTFKYIITRYNEDLNWLNNIMNDCIIYNKGKPLNIPNEILLENVGLSEHTILYYIINNYDSLPDVCIFSQARISDSLHFSNKPYDEKYPYYAYLEEIKDQAHKNGMSYHRLPKGNAWIDNFNIVINLNEKYREEKIPFIEWFNQNIDKNKKNLDKFFPCSIFAVSKKLILNRSVDFYKKLLKKVDWTIHPIEAAFLERCWYYIFNAEGDDINQ